LRHIFWFKANAVNPVEDHFLWDRIVVIVRRNITDWRYGIWEFGLSEVCSSEIAASVYKPCAKPDAHESETVLNFLKR
jgi:hypothetical protein